MNRSFITKMPDKAGAFLQASTIISKHNGNIVRVNYNRSIDMYTLFIDVKADDESILDKIEAELSNVGYLSNQVMEKRVILVSLKLLDVPGSVTSVLEILNRYNVNIYYMSAQETQTLYQNFKMGLHIEDPITIKNILEDISEICEVSILEYDSTEKTLDNTVFYLDFANKINALLALTPEKSNEFLVLSNRMMQLLDDRNEKPYRTFEYIKKYAELITAYKGEAFLPRISEKKFLDNLSLWLIEPPCGGNTYVFKTPEGLLFVDSGFGCYKNEMHHLLHELVENFDTVSKKLFLTHSDLDHIGLISECDTVFVSKSVYENFELENNGENNFREQNEYCNPYCKLSAIICGYTPPKLDNLFVVGEKTDNEEYISYIGSIKTNGLKFDLYEGNGGHVRGETIIVCEELKLVFTGDIFVNIKGLTKEQKNFNALAPYLMTSVDIDSGLAGEIRKKLLEKYKGYLLCPGHGKWLDNE